MTQEETEGASQFQNALAAQFFEGWIQFYRASPNLPVQGAMIYDRVPAISESDFYSRPMKIRIPVPPNAYSQPEIVAEVSEPPKEN